MKQVFTIFMLCFAFVINAQQLTQFTQFTFNKYGYNPAAAGTNINSRLEVISGLRKQWIGDFEAPATNFLSMNYTIKPERSYRYWQNVGLYTSNDKAGIYQNFSIYGSYTIHIPLTNRFIASVGLFAGARRFTIAKSVISPNDPVYAKTAEDLWVYPDIIPGIRLYNKKNFFDVSVHQLYKNKAAQNGKRIGAESNLNAHVYATFGKKIFFPNDFVVVPALNLHGSLNQLPSTEINLMTYYKSKIGVGISIRGANFLCGIFQARIYKNVTAGFAYDFTLNNYTNAHNNTLEFMIGLTPMMMLEGARVRHNVSKCPALDF